MSMLGGFFQRRHMRGRRMGVWVHGFAHDINRALHRGYAGGGERLIPEKAGCCRAAQSPPNRGKGVKFRVWGRMGYKHTQPQKDAENGRIKGLSQVGRDRSNPYRGGAEGNALKINAILI